MLNRMRRRNSLPGQPNPLGDSDQALIMLHRIEAALVVRDPGNARSAEAYDGLRKQVIAAANERRRLLVILAQLNQRLQAGSSAEDALSLVQEWSEQAGLQELTEPITAELFEITGSGPNLRLVRPAWIDSASGMVVSRGIAEAMSVEPVTEMPTSASPGTSAEARETAIGANNDPELDSEGEAR